MSEQYRHTTGEDVRPGMTRALTRRHFLGGAAGLAALALAACGGSATPTSAPAASTAPSTAPTTVASSAPSAAPAANAAPSTAASAAPSTAASAAPAAAATAGTTGTTGAVATVTRAGGPAATATGSAATPVAGLMVPPQNAFPATVTHQYGTTTIKQAPKRVLSIGYNDQDHLLALDIVPIGILRWFATQPRAVGPWAEAKLGNAQPEILPTTELDIEKVASLAPDLIIGIYRNMPQQEYDRLSQIAPTISMPTGYVAFGVPWRDEARMIAASVAQSSKMETIISGVEAKFVTAQKANPQFVGKTVSAVLVGQDNQYYAWSPEDSRIRFLEALGFTLAPAVRALKPTGFYTTLSAEQINVVDADFVMFVASTGVALDAAKANPLIQQLNAVKQNRTLFLSDPTLVQAFSMNTVLSLPYSIDQVVPQIAQFVRA